MANFRIGVSAKTLGLPFRRCLLEIAKLGARGVEIDAVGDFAPRVLSQTGQRELSNQFRSHDLTLAAVYCPIRKGLDVVENLDARLEALMEAMSLAFTLGPRKIIVPAGQIPEKTEPARFGTMREALEALGRHGDRIGCMVAIETGLDSAASVLELLNSLDVGSLGVCYNPGSLLINRHDPYATLRAFQRRILHIHASDARMISPQKLTTVPLGHGDVDWFQLLALFEELEYRGFVTIAEADGIEEVKRAVNFFRKIAGPNV